MIFPYYYGFHSIFKNRIKIFIYSTHSVHSVNKNKV